MPVFRFAGCLAGLCCACLWQVLCCGLSAGVLLWAGVRCGVAVCACLCACGAPCCAVSACVAGFALCGAAGAALWSALMRCAVVPWVCFYQ